MYLAIVVGPVARGPGRTQLPPRRAGRAPDRQRGGTIRPGYGRPSVGPGVAVGVAVVVGAVVSTARRVLVERDGDDERVLLRRVDVAADGLVVGRSVPVETSAGVTSAG